MPLNREKDLKISPVWMENRIPAYGARLKSAICLLSHCISCIDRDTEYGKALMPIAKWSKSYSMMCCAFGMLKKALSMMLGALPQQRYEEVIRETRSTYITSRPITSMGLLDERAVVCSDEDIRLLGVCLQESMCILCDGTDEERRKCKYRKAIKGLAFIDDFEDEKKFGQCIGQLMSWERK